MGNIFAIREGTSKDKKSIAMGSHQDTQPAGTFSLIRLLSQKFLQALPTRQLRLEAAGKKLGIVIAVQGMKWFCIRVSGVEGHSGTTPMG